MILVTLGTQDKKFYRLLNVIQKVIDDGIIKDKVIVQAGYSCDYKSNDMEILNLVSIEKFKKLISECDILITHGGVGSIITGLKENKKIIAVPRLKKYKEHTNDHQIQIVDNFVNDGRSQLFFVIAGFFLFYSPKNLQSEALFFIIRTPADINDPEITA